MGQWQEPVQASPITGYSVIQQLKNYYLVWAWTNNPQNQPAETKENQKQQPQNKTKNQTQKVSQL